MLQFQVEGMSCNHCVGAITRAVQAVDPSARVTADIPGKSVSVETAVATDAVRTAIVGAGYAVVDSA